ncbi:glutamate racemase [Candidatus Nitrosotenuis cloacae]|uniref:glutamate racemase n=1 Tax=Candidatus Nitrosotenuis cloacae TaxID=1603555 RepID=UPI0022826006|nr:glutamate racemase [Candidatus Nitrosotenuis cloacae]
MASGGQMGVGRIAVFDSGLGSLSIIKAIQKHTKSDIIYFADQKNFPYGKKSQKDLEKIIKNTVAYLRKKFDPDLIVIGSNTPSLLFNSMFLSDTSLVGVVPPIEDAQEITKTNSIALLVTSSVANSSALRNFVKMHRRNKIKITIVDSSNLVELVESGKFLTDQNLCDKQIVSTLDTKFRDNNVDVATLSSTHLPFLLPILQKIFPDVKFVDPADKVARQVATHKLFSPSARNTLKIFSSGNAKIFQTQLHNLGIVKTVHQISF